MTWRGFWDGRGVVEVDEGLPINFRCENWKVFAHLGAFIPPSLPSISASSPCVPPAPGIRCRIGSKKP